MKGPVALPEIGLRDALVSVEDEKTELDKILALLLDPKNIGHNTELNKNEITAFSVLSTLARRHPLPVLRDFLAENLEKRVSKGRSGRKEWVKIFSRQLSQNDSQADLQAGGLRRWMRKR